MAYHHRQHFVDPNHLLTETEYNDKSTHTCDICTLELAGRAGYYCNDCDIHIHKACADHFERSITFFADQHRLELIRAPSGDRVTHVCDLCRENCPPASFVYRCTECDFDLHPVCSLLPETVDSPLHPGHVLRMITSPSASCSACHHRLPLWHYVCSCSVNFKLHIACAMDMDEATGADDRGGGGPGIQDSYGAANQRGSGPAEHQGAAVDQRGFGPAGQPGSYYGNPVMFQGYYSPFHHSYIPNINIPGHGPAPGIPVQGFGPSIPGIHAPPIPGIYAPPILGQNPAVARPSRSSAIAKFLLKQSFGIAITVATGGLLGSM